MHLRRGVRLHYNYFRDYDPTVGRYIESDPVGLLGGLNTYAYANGSPAMYADPTGELAPAFWGAVWVYRVYVGYQTYGGAAAVAAAAGATAVAAGSMSPDAGHGGGDGCPPDDYCKTVREALTMLYQQLSQMSVGPTNSRTRFDVLRLQQQFNKAVDDYNKRCANSGAGPFTDKLVVGPQRPSIPGTPLLEDYYLR